MLNIEQPLECSQFLTHEVKNLSIRPYPATPPQDAIYAEFWTGGYRDYNYWFDRVTGICIGQDVIDNPLRLRPKSATRPINHFFLYAGERDWDKDHWVKLPYEQHPSGAAAAERMKHHNGLASSSLSPFRFIVKKEVELSPIRDFPGWAEFRFSTGEWKAVPWANEEWAIKDHYAHLGMADDCMVAFWPNEEQAAHDQVEVLSPGRYLTRYYSHILSNEQIRDWAVKVDVESELKFTSSDPEEIYEIYAKRKGPHSCMAYPDEGGSPHITGGKWRSGFNPVKVYGGGDLVVAYMERKSKIIARALCWPEKKICGRIYGDIERMQDAMIAAGYTMDSNGHGASNRGNGGFNGARLKRIAPEDLPHNLVLPYLDYGYSASVIDGDDQHLKLDRYGTIPGQRTDGLAYEPNCEPGRPPSAYDDDEDEDPCSTGDCDCCFNCDSCGDRESDDERYTVQDQWLCYGCYSNQASDCQSCDESFFRSNMTSTENGDRYCTSCAEEHVTLCDYCDERFNREDLNIVYDGRYEGTTPDDVHGDACNYCHEHDSRVVTDRNGNRVDASTVTECDECDTVYPANIDDCPGASCVEARTTELEPA